MSHSYIYSRANSGPMLATSGPAHAYAHVPAAPRSNNDAHDNDVAIRNDFVQRTLCDDIQSEPMVGAERRSLIAAVCVASRLSHSTTLVRTMVRDGGDA
jgi:hypothetical protein